MKITTIVAMSDLRKLMEELEDVMQPGVCNGRAKTMDVLPKLLRAIVERLGPETSDKLPSATREIFSKLLRRKVLFFEAGSVQGNSIFFSGTIDGRSFALTLAVDNPQELLNGDTL